MPSCVLLFATPWTVTHQVPLSMGFPRQEYWSSLPFRFPGNLPDPGIKPGSPALAGRFFTTEPPGKLMHVCMCICVCAYLCHVCMWCALVGVGVRELLRQSIEDGQKTPFQCTADTRATPLFSPLPFPVLQPHAWPRASPHSASATASLPAGPPSLSLPLLIPSILTYKHRGAVSLPASKATPSPWPMEKVGTTPRALQSPLGSSYLPHFMSF